MISRFGVRLPLLWLACAAVLVSGRALPSVLALAAALASVPIGPRVQLSRGVEVMICSFAALGAAAIAWLLPAGTTLAGWKSPSALQVALLLGPLFVAVARSFMKAPLGGEHTTLAIVLTGAIGAGAHRSGGLYAGFLAGLAVALWAAMRRLDRARAPLSSLRPRSLTLAAACGALALGTTMVLTWILPPLHDRAQSYAIAAFAEPGVGRSGFSRIMELGSLTRIISSEEKVFRVTGPHVDHLRGVVYDRYHRGRWITPIGAGRRRLAVGGAAPARAVEIESLGEETSAYFVPLQASAIGVPGGELDTDDHGLLMPAEGEAADRVWFVPEGTDRPPVSPPGTEDRELPPELASALRPLADEWTAGAQSDRAKLDAIVARLQRDYAYALEITRDVKKDPILEFLLDRKTGHCEYFASALALLARTSSIAARVAGGYLVTERSELGEYWIVRQSNAHAWVEAWVDGAWVTFDPTPASGLEGHMARSISGADAYRDLIAHAAGRAIGWMKRRTTGQLLAAIALGLAFVFRVELRSLITRRKRVPRHEHGYSAPWPEVTSMLTVLAARGLERRPGETLVRFAERLDGETAVLLRRYAAHRHGGVGDRAALERELGAWLARPR